MDKCTAKDRRSQRKRNLWVKRMVEMMIVIGRNRVGVVVARRRTPKARGSRSEIVGMMKVVSDLSHETVGWQYTMPVAKQGHATRSPTGHLANENSNQLHDEFTRLILTITRDTARFRREVQQARPGRLGRLCSVRPRN